MSILYRHKTRGTTYVRLADAPLQCAAPFTAAEDMIFTVYISTATGKAYCRPINEFDDGRFELIGECTPERGMVLPRPNMPEPKPHIHAAAFAAEAANTIVTDMLVHIFDNDREIENLLRVYQTRIETYLQRRIEEREL